MPTANGRSLNGHSESLQISVDAAQNGRPGHSSIPVNWERLARATAHPLRVSILEILGIDGGRVLSPSDLSRELQIPLSNTNYHVTELAKSGLIELVRERQVRGATEHFYRLPAETSEATSEGESEADSEEESPHPLAVAA
jgi:DNA-binding transcriptional ArsR family regulator